ncbi:MAG: hypothetical protein H7844_11040 [Nitrospirae bacterium YQR-1]
MGKIERHLLKKKEKIFMGDDYKLLVPLAEEFKKYDMAEAVTILKYCVKKHPDYMSAHVSLGKIYMENGYTESAIEEFERVINVIPNNILSQRKLATLYEQTGQIGKAIMSHKMVLILNPGDTVATESIKALTGNDKPASLQTDTEPLSDAELEALISDDETPETLSEQNQPDELSDFGTEAQHIEKYNEMDDTATAAIAAEVLADIAPTEPEVVLDDITEELLSDSGDEIEHTEKLEDIEEMIAASLEGDVTPDIAPTEPEMVLDDITEELLSDSGDEIQLSEHRWDSTDDTTANAAGDFIDDGSFILSPNEPVSEEEEDTETIIAKDSAQSNLLQDEQERQLWDPFAEPSVAGIVNGYGLQPLVYLGDVDSADAVKDVSAGLHSEGKNDIIELTEDDYISGDEAELSDSDVADLLQISPGVNIIRDSSVHPAKPDASDLESPDITIISDSEMKALISDIPGDEQADIAYDFDSDMKELILDGPDSENAGGTAGFSSDITELIAAAGIYGGGEIDKISDTVEQHSLVGMEDMSAQEQELLIKDEIEMIENYILTERFLSAIKAYNQLHERFPNNTEIKQNLDNLRTSARLLDKDENALIRKLDFLKGRLKEKMRGVSVGPAYS